MNPQIEQILTTIDEILESLPTKQQIVVAIRYENPAGVLEKPIAAARERLQQLREELSPAVKTPDRSARGKNRPSAQAGS